MTALRAFQKTFAILAIAFGLAVGASLLPENPYQRWQLLDGTIQAHARWIYERCNFDPTPIDVAFIGPSRTEAGIDAPRLGQALAARGLPSHVVNFSLPEAGRNINYVIAEQLFRTKHPQLLVIGVTEKPSRFGHPAYKYIAEPGLIADPGYLGNINYLSDLIYLPFRQMRLFIADIAPGGAGLAKQFDASQYAGPSIETTGSRRLPDGTIKEGERPASAAELARGVRKFKGGMHAPVLPARFADIEFGDDHHYTRLIADLAKAHGTKVVFLAVPFNTGPSAVQEAAFYNSVGPLWNAGFLSPHAELYADYGHLTRTGAHLLTDWLVDPVARQLSPATVPDAAKASAPAHAGGQS